MHQCRRGNHSPSAFAYLQKNLGLIALLRAMAVSCHLSSPKNNPTIRQTKAMQEEQAEKDEPQAAPESEHWDREAPGFKARQISVSPDIAEIELTARYPSDWKMDARNSECTMEVEVTQGRIAFNANGHETCFCVGDRIDVPAGLQYSWKIISGPVRLRVTSTPAWHVGQHEEVPNGSVDPESHPE